jgi:hypothetical protein
MIMLAAIGISKCEPQERTSKARREERKVSGECKLLGVTQLFSKGGRPARKSWAPCIALRAALLEKLRARSNVDMESLRRVIDDDGSDFFVLRYRRLGRHVYLRSELYVE